jgi:mRNA interferase MazF
MQIKRFEIWIADLNPQIGTEPGKARPVLVVQTNLLNKLPHSSTIICPITTNTQKESEILRVHINKGTSNLKDNCDVMIDQVRAIDNKRLIKKIGELPDNLSKQVIENLSIILDLI